MSLLLVLVIGAPLLGSAAGFAGASPEILGIVDGLADICLEAAEQTVTAEVKAEVRAELRGVQRLTATLQEQLTEQQSVVHEHLTALQQQQTTLQEQLTVVQDRLSPSLPAAGGCPSNWSWSGHGDSCYLVPQMKATWLEAHQACAAFDRRARLVSVHASNRNHVNSVLTASGEKYVWIGLVRPRGDDRWGWSDGTPLDFTDWRSGQPASSEMQGCVFLDTGSSGKWFNYQCGDEESFMCQIRLI